MRFVVVFFLFGWGWLFVDEKAEIASAPEICDNGIDDDMDGLVDLNDTIDCVCNGISEIIYTPSSIIPNPSFEDTLCCPQGVAQLTCAANWIQASSATSDFFHTCGFDEDQQRGRPPMPLPSGDAFVGFLDIQGIFGRLYKEYVGACLNQPMSAGTEYTLQFYLGFGRPGMIYSANSPVTIVLYGTNDCTELPFGGPNYQDCPSDLPEWFEIDRVVVSGSNEWVRTTMMFRAPSSVEAVAIGTSCLQSSGDHYYFLDDLVLNVTDEFRMVDLDINGEVCDDEVTLSTIFRPSLTYQWYRNGVAVQGAIDETYTVGRRDTGTYVVRISDSTDCEISQPYLYYPIDYISEVDTAICPGQLIALEGVVISDVFDSSFVYPGVQYCDSIIHVKVSLLDSSVATIDTVICRAASVRIAGQDYSNPGEYRLITSNFVGCDSIIYLNLSISDTIQEMLDTFFCQGGNVAINGQAYSSVGTFTQMSQNADGCDVALNINVREQDTSYIIKDTMLCRGDLLRRGGNPVGLSGLYPFRYISQFGCDSTIVYQVELRDTFRMYVDTFFCSGESIELGGRTVNTAQTLEVDFFTANSCDSTVVYRVLEVAPFFQDIDTFVCAGGEVVFRGDTLRDEDVYMFVSNQLGVCDSTWRVNLEVGENYITYFDSTICPKQTITWHGQVLMATGIYHENVRSASGCDSLLEMSLTILDEIETELEMLSEISCYGMADGIAKIHTSEENARVIWPDNFEGHERSGLDVGNYDLTIINGPGCISTFEFVLDQPEPLELVVYGKNANCQDDHSGAIELEKMTGGTGVLSVFVNGQRRYPVDGIINGLASGQYEIDLMDENGCLTSSEILIDQLTAGSFDLSATDVSIVEGDSVVLILTTQGIDSLILIDWYGPDGSCFDCDTWTVFPSEGLSNYHVFAIDNNDCEYEAFIQIEAQSRFYAPNAFSPNGDQLNDYFTLFADRSVEVISEFKVFDRWGEMVHFAQSVEPGQADGAWDGTFRGEYLVPGVYVYVMEVLDKSGDTHFLYGEVTLIR